MNFRNIISLKLVSYCFQWHPTLLMLKDRLEEVTGINFNSMLANLYRDGHDSVAWHSDDELILGPEPTIASLTFGDTRNFELRKKPPPVIIQISHLNHRNSSKLNCTDRQHCITALLFFLKLVTRNVSDKFNFKQ